jgi:hypothetical protein
MDRDFMQGKIRQLIAKEWMTDQDLMSLYTILVALPLSRAQNGPLSDMLQSLADVIDHDLRTLFTGGQDNEHHRP